MLIVLKASVICFVRTFGSFGLSATKGHDADRDMIVRLLRILRLVFLYCRLWGGKSIRDEIDE